MPTHTTEDYDDLRERFEWADVFEWPTGTHPMS